MSPPRRHREPQGQAQLLVLARNPLLLALAACVTPDLTLFGKPQNKVFPSWEARTWCILLNSSRGENRETWGLLFGPNSAFLSQNASKIPAGGRSDAAGSLGTRMGRVPSAGRRRGAEFRCRWAKPGFLAEYAGTKFANHSPESSASGIEPRAARTETSAVFAEPSAIGPVA